MALLTAIFIVACAVLLPGFWSRIAIFLALIFGYAISWLFDRVGKVHSALPGSTVKTDHFRINWDGVKAADWIGFPHKTTIGPDGKELVGWHTPSFSLTFILLVLPGVIALLAENTGHVKAVGEMTGEDLDPYLGRAFIGDGVGTVVASSVGGSPTTTYAENIGVMAATRVYSTAAYYVAAIVAILLGFCPKFGAIVSATPGGVLGGITVVLYGMIGLLGAKIWVENRVDFANPANLVPLAAGIVAGIGGVSMNITKNFSISGIALGTIFVLVGYHGVRPFLPPHLREEPQAAGRAYEGGTMMSTGNVETPEGELSPFRVDDAVDKNEEGRRRE